MCTGSVIGGGIGKISGQDIVSQGSNANGYWVRLYDGTQICWGGKSYTNVAFSGSTVGYTGYYAITYAIAFSNNPKFIPTAASAGVPWAADPSVSTTGASFRFCQVGTVTRTTVCNYIAIGRWK